MTSLLNPAYRSSKLFISLIEQRAASSRLLLLENGASMLLIAHAKNLRARHNYFLSPGVYRIDFRSICFFPSPCYTPTPGHLHVLLFSRSVMSDSLRPHGLRHSRLPCPPPSHRVGSNSCPLSWWCHPTTSSSATPLLLLPSIFPSIKGLSNESALHIRWPKYWSISFSICPSNEYSGLISFRIDWLDLLAVQGTLKSLLQHHSSKESFFGIQLFSLSSSHIRSWLLEKR